jgi:hypothetical protein
MLSLTCEPRIPWCAAKDCPMQRAQLVAILAAFSVYGHRLFVNVTREELQGSAGLGRRKTVKKDKQ